MPCLPSAKRHTGFNNLLIVWSPWALQHLTYVWCSAAIPELGSIRGSTALRTHSLWKSRCDRHKGEFRFAHRRGVPLSGAKWTVKKNFVGIIRLFVLCPDISRCAWISLYVDVLAFQETLCPYWTTAASHTLTLKTTNSSLIKRLQLLPLLPRCWDLGVFGHWEGGEDRLSSFLQPSQWKSCSLLRTDLGGKGFFLPQASSERGSELQTDLGNAVQVRWEDNKNIQQTVCLKTSKSFFVS